MSDRVQIPAYTDHWMRGDRYGTVIKVFTRQFTAASGLRYEREIANVKLDISGKTARVILNDCTPV